MTGAAEDVADLFFRKSWEALVWKARGIAGGKFTVGDISHKDDLGWWSGGHLGQAFRDWLGRERAARYTVMD